MTSHELAKLLLEHPDMPIATHANNHTASYDQTFRVGIMKSYLGEGILIGNFSRRKINFPNEHVTSMLLGDVPDNWR